MDVAKLMNNYNPPQATFVKGSGVELWDDEGDRYLDFLSGIAVTSLGHSHPVVAAAVKAQAGKLTHVSNFFANEHTHTVVQELDRLLRLDDCDCEPGRILFQNSGAETIEAAIKLVRKYQGRERHIVVSAYSSFHGRTLGALAATGQPKKQAPFQPLPEGFRYTTFNDLDALESVLDANVGAVLLESIQGEGGVIPATEDYLTAVRELCDQHRILLIMDEIQTGLARTGRWFGYQHAGIQPDIVTMAKALGNGMPVGAMWARKHIADAFVPGDHGSTFAGQPLALSAVAAVLETMIDMDAPAVVGRLGTYLTEQLEKLDGVDHVRGRGLLIGVEISKEALDGRTAKDIAEQCLGNGLVVNGVNETTLRLAPPFVADEAHISEGVAIIGSVLENRSNRS